MNFDEREDFEQIVKDEMKEDPLYVARLQNYFIKLRERYQIALGNISVSPPDFEEICLDLAYYGKLLEIAMIIDSQQLETSSTSLKGIFDKADAEAQMTTAERELGE